MIIGNLIIQMSANLAKLSDDMGKAKGTVTQTVTEINNILKTIGVGISFKEISDFVVQTNALTASFERLGVIAGTTAENMSKFELVSKLAGTSMESIALSIARLSRSVGEAKLGDAGKAGLLDALGIDFEGLDPEQQFEKLGRALAEMNDKNIASKISTELLGRAYAELRPTFEEIVKQGSLNSTVTEEQAKQAKQAEDNWKQLEQVWIEGARSLVSDLVPVLDQVQSRFLKINKEKGWLDALADFALTFHPLKMAMSLFAPTDLGEEDLPQEKQPASSAATAINAAASAEAKARETRVAQYEKFLKDYPRLMEQEKAEVALYADQLRLEQSLVKDAYALGNIHQEEQVQKMAEIEDARLQVLRASLVTQEGYAKKKHDLVEAQKIQDQIDLVDSQRRTNKQIAQAQVDTIALQKARANRDAGGKAFSDTDKFIDDLAFKRDAEQRWYDERLAALAAFGSIGSEEEIKAQKAREYLAEEHRDRMVAIAQDEWQHRVLFAQFTNRDLMATNQYIFGALAELMQSHSQRMFQIGKVAAIANTIISTYEGAQKAYSALVGIPVIGPVLATAAAAAAIVVGLQRVQAIRSTEFNSGSVASPTFSAQPGTAIPSSPVQSAPAAAPSSQTVVNVNVTGVVTQDVVDQMLEQLRDAINNRDAILIGVNSRQAANLATV